MASLFHWVLSSLRETSASLFNLLNFHAFPHRQSSIFFPIGVLMVSSDGNTIGPIANSKQCSLKQDCFFMVHKSCTYAADTSFVCDSLVELVCIPHSVM